MGKFDWYHFMHIFVNQFPYFYYELLFAMNFNCSICVIHVLGDEISKKKQKFVFRKKIWHLIEID